MNGGMSSVPPKKRIHWLNASLELRKEKSRHLLKRLQGCLARFGTEIFLHKKFIRFLDQIAEGREKELHIIAKIEKLERRHKATRQRKLLKQASLRQKEDDFRRQEEWDALGDARIDKMRKRELHALMMRRKKADDWLAIIGLVLMFKKSKKPEPL